MTVVSFSMAGSLQGFEERSIHHHRGDCPFVLFLGLRLYGVYPSFRTYGVYPSFRTYGVYAFPLFSQEKGIHHSFFCSVTSRLGDRPRKEGSRGGGVYLSGPESRIANRTIPRITGLESPEIPQREAKKWLESQKNRIVENPFGIAIWIASYQCLIGRREKTPTPKTRFSIWTLLRTPGRFTTRPLPAYFTTKVSVVRLFSVLSKDEIDP